MKTTNWFETSKVDAWIKGRLGFLILVGSKDGVYNEYLKITPLLTIGFVILESNGLPRNQSRGPQFGLSRLKFSSIPIPWRYLKISDLPYVVYLSVRSCTGVIDTTNNSNVNGFQFPTHLSYIIVLYPQL